MGRTIAVFLVEGQIEFATPAKCARHHLAVIGMDDCEPAFKGALVVGTNAEDLVEHLGRGPKEGFQIEDVRAKASNALRLLQ